MNYDAWLEKPYTDQAALEEKFENWCALTGTDPDLVGAWEQFERELDCEE